jgi:hypothetical protein
MAIEIIPSAPPKTGRNRPRIKDLIFILYSLFIPFKNK